MRTSLFQFFLIYFLSICSKRRVEKSLVTIISWSRPIALNLQQILRDNMIYLCLLIIIYISALEAFPGLKFCLIKDKKSSQFTSAPVNPIIHSRKENKKKNISNFHFALSLRMLSTMNARQDTIKTSTLKTESDLGLQY